MTLPEIVARLAREPFNLTPAQVGRLTLPQVALLLCDPENLADPGPMPPTRRQRFDTWARLNKLPGWLAEKLWTERPADGL